ncbi:MAG TPA: hypothetical protein VNK82_13370 [Terriglobales bacterium]|nr:hypothetical protein [Terriglobales bacterium]
MNDSLAKLELARNAPRCNHFKADGRRCGSPAIKGKRLCYAHLRARYPQKNGLLPALRDDEAVACAAMQVARALTEQSLDPRTASLLLWSLQIAKSTFRGDDDKMTR